MEILIKASQLILSLSILVALHELGHFIPAKLFKTRVEKFYLFFNPWFSLYKVKRGETEYGLGWLPLGGYVKISGMIDESMDKDQMEKPPEDWEFRSKPVWQRLIIMLGGVIVNLVLGFLIYMMILGVWGKDYLPTKELTNGYNVHEVFEKHGFRDGDVVLEVDGEPLEDALEINKLILVRNAKEFKVRHQDGVVETIILPNDIDYEMFRNDAMFMPRLPTLIDTVIPKDPASKAGLKKGDIITAVNGNKTEFWGDVHDEIMASKGEEMQIAFMRDGTSDTLYVQGNKEGKIGVSPLLDLTELYTLEHKDFSFTESISSGFSYGWWTLHDYVAQMKYLATEKGASSLGGFGTFGSLFAATWDWHRFWEMTALISIILAFMNILPIPALDGGHVMFLLYEMIAGKPPNQKFMEYAQLVGMIVLIGLIIYANGNDIFKALQ